MHYYRYSAFILRTVEDCDCCWISPDEVLVKQGIQKLAKLNFSWITTYFVVSCSCWSRGQVLACSFHLLLHLSSVLPFPWEDLLMWFSNLFAVIQQFTTWRKSKEVTHIIFQGCPLNNLRAHCLCGQILLRPHAGWEAAFQLYLWLDFFCVQKATGRKREQFYSLECNYGIDCDQRLSRAAQKASEEISFCVLNPVIHTEDTFNIALRTSVTSSYAVPQHLQTKSGGNKILCPFWKSVKGEGLFP